MPVRKRIPMRKCTGCRGAYVCRSSECLAKAIKAKRFEKAFSCEIPSEVYQKMEEEMKNGG